MVSLRLPSLLLLALLPTAAHAAMIGNPVSQPRAGWVSLAAAADTQAVVFDAQDCAGSSCEAVWRPSQFGGRIEVALLPGLGLQGGGSWLRENINEATYAGVGGVYWGGVEAAIPVGHDLFLAAVGQFEHSSTREQSAGSDRILGRAVSNRLRVAGLLAWAPDDDSFCLYGGLAFHPLHDHYTVLEDLDVQLQLGRSSPFQGALGLEMRSGPLGLPWASSSGRMVLGVEARIERGLAGGLTLGAAF